MNLGFHFSLFLYQNTTHATDIISSGNNHIQPFGFQPADQPG
jgi:hypothetical protein